MRQSRRGFVAALGAAAFAGCAAPAAQETGDPESESGPSVYARTYEAVAPAVVRVRVYDDGIAGQGSGFLRDGHVVTNDHVVANASTVRVQYESGEWREVDVVGRDPYSDLAVLSTGGEPPAEGLTLVEPAPPIGTEVMAIGTPFGLGGSVTTGVISGRNRSLPARNGFTIADAVQTDAAVNPGNSGGPLVTLDGDVVGVVSATQGDDIGFAVSAALARRVVPELVADGEYEHSYMGVRILQVTPLVAEANDLPEAAGVYVAAVEPGGPADGVLRGSDGTETVEGAQVPVGGDVVVGLDGNDVDQQEVLSSYLALETSPGDTLEVTVLRDGAERTVELELGERPDPTL